MQLPSIPAVQVPDLSSISKPSIPGLASSTFESGPKDDVATADVYSLMSAVDGAEASAITSIQQLELGVQDSLFGLKLKAGEAADFLSKTKEGLMFDKNVLTERLLGTNSEFRDMYNGLNDKLKQGAMLKTYAQQKAAKLQCTINDTKSMVDSANIKDVRALGSFINKYTKSNIFSGQDSGAISGLLGSVITTASDLGIPGAFKAITDTVNDNGILGRVTRAVLPIALRNSDTKMLRDLSSSTAGKLINVFDPGFTQNFSKAFVYRGDRGHTLNSFEDIFHSFENVDSMWDSMSRGDPGNTAVNLLALVGGSRDFSNLLMTGVKYWSAEQAQGRPSPVRVQPVHGLASVYREVTVGDAIKRDFPNVALLSQYNDKLPKQGGNPAGMRNASNQNVVDARLIKGSIAALLGL
ncbi:hypothetical protein [Ralstonia phage RP31]|uniref:Uncharacterized protein n=1 Tax=Ralstonia phage RP31 TaxID=1923890 RepID=A0A1L7N1F9_9CAUD|nr:hypothetical protein [Ralstonia phage RP31]